RVAAAAAGRASAAGAAVRRGTRRVQNAISARLAPACRLAPVSNIPGRVAASGSARIPRCALGRGGALVGALRQALRVRSGWSADAGATHADISAVIDASVTAAALRAAGAGHRAPVVRSVADAVAGRAVLPRYAELAEVGR